MGLYKRGKIWWVQLTVNGRHPCFSTHTSSKRLAQKILDIRRAEIAEGRFPGLLKSNAPTLNEYLSKFLESRADLHRNTLVRYKVSQRCLPRNSLVPLVFRTSPTPESRSLRQRDFEGRQGQQGSTGIFPT